MTRETRRAFKQQFDFEDDEDDPYGGDDTEDEYLPRRTRAGEIDSDNSTSSESEPANPIPVSRRDRGRGRSYLGAVQSMLTQFGQGEKPVLKLTEALVPGHPHQHEVKLKQIAV
ncbi:unnamed protein product [Arctia plantaginis]|uniref:Uncharacterized protein n=1 Tax=Arctia plantaginis TaxID=874455 RepID=A0A8S0YZ63_ARCPL|nr:unnamed protein product [Arctia plantaginis]